ncbi:MAG: aminopeptidase [Bacteroidota bacterium]|nr:aminopeptidase [Bacteroidota bacterium]
MKLLEKMCNIHAPSGEEVNITKFILKYIKENQDRWTAKPMLHHGDGFQDNIVLVFGTPRTAIFAHMDSIGFTVKYKNEIIKIGGPITEEGIVLVGQDKKGKIEGKIIKKKHENKEKLFIDFYRQIEKGTSLTFKTNFRESKNFIKSSYLDNRLGIWNALKVAESLKNGIICFSSWEEHGGGSIGYLAKFIYEKYNVSQALISDITWVTKSVRHGKGAAISLRDSGIPRRSYIVRILDIVKRTDIPFQLEVEDSGGSDGNQLQISPYPFDWCFIGAPESNVHSPSETVHKKDIVSMLELYKHIMEVL